MNCRSRRQSGGGLDELEQLLAVIHVILASVSISLAIGDEVRDPLNEVIYLLHQLGLYTEIDSLEFLQVYRCER